MNDTDAPLIDPDKTDLVVKLCEIPQGDRDAGWHNEFFNAVSTAAFCVPPEADKQMMIGPDGFPYLLFFVPPAEREVEMFSIRSVLDVCLQQGVGVAIYPEAMGKPLWVVPYGVLLSYRLTGAFDARGPATTPTLPGSMQRQVMVSQPNEQYLPGPTRALLRRYLQANGLAEPALFVMDDPALQPARQIVFNAFPEDFKSPEHHREVVRRLAWYLPPHYAVATLPGKHTQFQESFKPI